MPSQIKICPSFSQPPKTSRIPYYSTIGRLELILSLIDRDGYRCQLCGELLPQDSWKLIDIDHKVPRSKGGGHELENLQLTHKSCNVRKYDGTPYFCRFTPEVAQARRQRSIEVRVAQADKRALEVQRMLSDGLTAIEIANKIGCSRKTIYNLKKRTVSNP